MEAFEIVMHYHRKPGTKTSYNREPGPGPFPERIGFSLDGFTPIKRTGAAYIHSKMGQVKADFKKTEASLYKPAKALKPFIHFTLFWFDERKDFGFANVGYSGESGRVIPTNDLVVARFLDPEGLTLEISLFPGQHDKREEVVHRLRVKNKRA
jgi:hypothetical protein